MRPSADVGGPRITRWSSLTVCSPPRRAALDEAERGRRRFAYDEVFFLQVLHARARQRARSERPGTAFARTDALIGPLCRGLPFQLTAAQTRAIAEIFADMTSPRRMNRLLQGDV